MGAAFVLALLAAPADSRRPSLERIRPLVRIGSEIFVRTTALYASFLVASAVLARVGEDSLGRTRSRSSCSSSWRSCSTPSRSRGR